VIGEKIGHFEITGRAGRGGMGEVFVAEHAAIKTRVAIKVLHADVSANTDHVQRFFNEARAVARIQHAGIVKIFDVGFHAERAYLIMEFLEGETLAGRLRRSKRLSARKTAEIARQIANILDATHHAEIIHRDLKPENVFLVQDRELASGERVKVLDFGIAKLSSSHTGPSPTTVGAMGTPAYMAPEQWSDSSTVDWRADVYSLGCIVYEMAAGRTPFASSSIAEACAKHLNDTPASLRAYAPDVPVALDTLALRLLAKDPARRIASIHALEQRFAELASSEPDLGDVGETQLAYDPVGVTQSPTTLTGAASMTRPPASSRRKTISVAGALALAGAAAVIGWRLWPAEPGRPGESRAVIAASPVAAPVADAPAVADHALRDWLDVANPFVASHGTQWLAHQVNRREYRRFLESLQVSEALGNQPVNGWDNRDEMLPVGWVTYERAAAFCAAIGAALPTAEQWLAASDGEWGLDPAGVGRRGPLREWTATVDRDGLVEVRGGHERMSPADRAAAASEPLMKSSEAQAGPSPAPNVVASETIGFRCVR
jgi:tRNA A-37 threonylcarbamoyl transferase component Bud32